MLNMKSSLSSAADKRCRQALPVGCRQDRVAGQCDERFDLPRALCLLLRGQAIHRQFAKKFQANR